MKNRYSMILKLLISFVLLVNLAALTSCKSKESGKDSGQEENILENDGEIEIQIPEDEETFGE